MFDGILELFDIDLGGIFDDFFDFGAKDLIPLGAGAMGIEGQRETNQANAEQARLNREFQASQADKTMAFSAEQAATQRQFQSEQTGSEVQRRVADLQKAGLNPMLAYQGAAGSAAGAMANRPQPGGAQAVMGNKVAAGMGAGFSAAQMQNMNIQNELLRAQVDKTNAETVQTYSSAGQLDAQRDNIRQEMQTFQDRWDKIALETRVAIDTYKATAEHPRRYDEVVEAKRMKMINEAKKLGHEAEILGLKIPEAIQEARFFRSHSGQDAMHFRHAPKSLTSAGMGAMGGIAQDTRDAFKLKGARP